MIIRKLQGHDHWGSALGMRYARLNEGNVRSVAFMETHILPGVPVPNYEAMGPMAPMFRNIRTKGVGEKMILEENFFIEEVLPKMVMRKLTDKEMAEYRRPFPTPVSRLPTLMWPRELTGNGEPTN